MSAVPVVQLACAQEVVTHWPLVLHEEPEPQVPQVPLQPSLPQVLPVQLGVQLDTHCPLALQLVPLAQLPQVPEQPSLPHTLPLQLGVQVEQDWLQTDCTSLTQVESQELLQQ